MTAALIDAFAVGCVVLVLAHRPARPGAPQWMLPPLPDAVFEYRGAVEGWSPMAAVAAAPEGDGPPLALTTADVAALAVDQDVTDALDAIEATLSAELDWRIASALLWLGADLEAEHALASLADYPGDHAWREEVLSR